MIREIPKKILAWTIVGLSLLYAALYEPVGPPAENPEPQVAVLHQVLPSPQEETSDGEVHRPVAGDVPVDSADGGDAGEPVEFIPPHDLSDESHLPTPTSAAAAAAVAGDTSSIAPVPSTPDSPYRPCASP